MYVTQPVLPPLEEFIPYLERIWHNKILTNNGEFHRELESALCKHLGVPYISLFSNGTLALITALQALRVRGEVITTPYSFVATGHSLLWNGLTPVFVDIDPVTFNLDASKLAAAITPQTTAILPVHCYGQPCAVGAIKEVGDAYNLRVIYDAAHAFGVRDSSGSILNYGDLSVLSFHATKVFNTFEGGAIVCQDERTKRHIDNLKNFGFMGEAVVVAPGINGKMSEVNAAFGLLQLKHVDQALARRRAIAREYLSQLSGIDGIHCVLPADCNTNYSYFPVLVRPPYRHSRDELQRRLGERGIYSRRYFFPLISELPMYRGLPSARRENLPVAAAIADTVLCLPIYPALASDDVRRICAMIAEG